MIFIDHNFDHIVSSLYHKNAQVVCWITFFPPILTIVHLIREGDRLFVIVDIFQLDKINIDPINDKL